MPPLEALEESSSGDENLTVIPVNDVKSDGDRSIWPTHPRFAEADPAIYLKKLATMWVKEMGGYEPGHEYSLNQLPDGYILLSRARISQPETRDKFLYGHPSGAYFDSPNRFWPHFYYLVTGRKSPCECLLCGKYGASATRDAGEMGRRRDRGVKRGASTTQTRGRAGRSSRRPARSHLAVDEEGTQDVFKELVYRLSRERTLDEEIKEPDSMDWRAERTQLRHHFTRISMQYSFIPRVGELVLWVPELEGDEICYNEKTGTFQVYCRKRKKFIGFPKWRAGTVAQVPEETVNLQDAVEQTDKRYNVNMSGFRVETFPDPNSTDKSLSRQYRYVPLCNIRPFNYWDVYLQYYPTEKFHDSIKYALTIMSSFSMLEKYRFKGEWPNADIWCRGIYLGAELLMKGDAVCLMPDKVDDPDEQNRRVTDVLVIKSIRLELTSCNADLSSPLLCEKTAAIIYGKAYTISPERAYRAGWCEPKPLTIEEIIDAFEITGMKGYGTWYHLHDPEHELRVSLDRIIGRLYESDYMEIMFGEKIFGLELDGVVNGRWYGRQTDERIPQGGEWYCGDYRMETLALETFNGLEVGLYDEARDLRMWRANLRIIDGTATPRDLRDAKVPRDFGRPRTGLIGATRSSTFESVGKTSTMVRTALEPAGPSSRASPLKKGETEEEDEVEESGNNVEDDGSTDELAEFFQPMYVRGGTEESAGGDYRPEAKRAKRR
ncbi:hypothetical protein VTO42DRAFT_4573 [Malbranchea cinnamomea]